MPIMKKESDADDIFLREVTDRLPDKLKNNGVRGWGIFFGEVGEPRKIKASNVTFRDGPGNYTHIPEEHEMTIQSLPSLIGTVRTCQNNFVFINNLIIDVEKSEECLTFVPAQNFYPFADNNEFHFSGKTINNEITDQIMDRIISYYKNEIRTSIKNMKDIGFEYDYFNNDLDHCNFINSEYFKYAVMDLIIRIGRHSLFFTEEPGCEFFVNEIMMPFHAVPGFTESFQELENNKIIEETPMKHEGKTLRGFYKPNEMLCTASEKFAASKAKEHVKRDKKAKEDREVAEKSNFHGKMGWIVGISAIIVMIAVFVGGIYLDSKNDVETNLPKEPEKIEKVVPKITESRNDYPTWKN